MKRNGILNAKLAKIVAGMGHTDKLVIGDCGLPVPYNADLVDLALTVNIPGFLDTLRVILSEFKAEEAIVAKEITESGSGIYSEIEKLLPGIRIRNVSHEEFKNFIRSGQNIHFVRTGEATPYANIILISGVTF